jgi:hypothetical protein
LTRDYLHIFPKLPERIRLFRLIKTHANKTNYFLAEPTSLGVTDTYKIELIHPKQFGLFVDWACDTANVHDSAFRPLIGWYTDSLGILSDGCLHGKIGDPSNMNICQRGT